MTHLIHNVSHAGHRPGVFRGQLDPQDHFALKTVLAGADALDLHVLGSLRNSLCLLNCNEMQLWRRHHCTFLCMSSSPGLNPRPLFSPPLRLSGHLALLHVQRHSLLLTVHVSAAAGAGPAAPEARI